MKAAGFLFALILVAAHQSGVAANTPSSGKKGGVSHCAGAEFICNDGSVSASKKVCSMSNRQQLLPLAKDEKDDDGGCSCRSHRYCTGPRGGQFCYTDSGNKSYRRR
jgi:hypothetical protein